MDGLYGGTASVCDGTRWSQVLLIQLLKVSHSFLGLQN